MLTLSSRVGFTGNDTPIYENFFAGGFSTLRGFDFRGASPVESRGVQVGGEFELINTLEYLFPLTADDMIHGVVFCDFGTVEAETSTLKDNFRVAPGFGLRITVPAMGPAPIALDFAFPVAKADTDDTASLQLQHRPATVITSGRRQRKPSPLGRGQRVIERVRVRHSTRRTNPRQSRGLSGV